VVEEVFILKDAKYRDRQFHLEWVVRQREVMGRLHDKLATIASEDFGQLLAQSAEDNLIVIEMGIDVLRRKSDAAMRALELIAEDCESWLAGECDDPSAEFIKLVAKFAREKRGLW